MPPAGNGKTQITSEVVLGMAYLHNQKPAIIHGDLTCGNILIGYEYHAKVSDFGLARMKEMSKTRTEKLRGTKKYIAPEYFIDPKKKKDRVVRCLWICDMCLGNIQ